MSRENGFQIQWRTDSAGQPESQADLVAKLVDELSSGLYDGMSGLPEGTTSVPSFHIRYEPTEGFCFPAAAACGFGKNDTTVEAAEQDLIDALMTNNVLSLPDGVATPDYERLVRINEAFGEALGKGVAAVVDPAEGFNKFHDPGRLGKELGREVSRGNPLIVLYGWEQPAQPVFSWGFVPEVHYNPSSMEKSYWKLYKIAQGRGEKLDCRGLATEIIGHNPGVLSATVLSLRRPKITGSASMSSNPGFRVIRR
jgi:hypothetical protein